LTEFVHPIDVWAFAILTGRAARGLAELLEVAGGVMTRWLKTVLIIATLSVLVPAAAQAQSSIAGQVKDTSGGVLPGVTVEASSPVLIEQTRSAVSDSQGQYNIIDLRPGT
jgi:hypothetical protein